MSRPEQQQGRRSPQERRSLVNHYLVNTTLTLAEIAVELGENRHTVISDDRILKKRALNVIYYGQITEPKDANLTLEEKWEKLDVAWKEEAEYLDGKRAELATTNKALELYAVWHSYPEEANAHRARRDQIRKEMRARKRTPRFKAINSARGEVAEQLDGFITTDRKPGNTSAIAVSTPEVHIPVEEERGILTVTSDPVPVFSATENQFPPMSETILTFIGDSREDDAQPVEDHDERDR